MLGEHKAFALEGLTDLACETPGVERGLRRDLQGARLHLGPGKSIPTNRGHLK